MGEPAACALCGLPVGSEGGAGPAFCCPGCRNVYQILSQDPKGPPADFRDTDLYRVCTAVGLIPAKTAGAAPPPGTPGADLAQELTFRIDGMWCPACAWWIEEVLRRTEGVLEARVSFASDVAAVRHLPHRASAQALLDRVSRLGYRARRVEEPAERARERRARGLRLGVSCLLTAHLMMISMALYGGFLVDLGPDGVHFLSLPQGVLATPVVFYGGWPILRRAWGGVRAGIASMDTLIAVGSLSSYVYSLVALANGSLHLYFDTAAMLITLTLVGRAVEGRARDRVLGETPGLSEGPGGKARLWTASGERWAAAAAVKPGDEVVVGAGERVPVDGVIVSGHAHLDESSLTGEARPVPKGPGDDVPGGALLLEGDARVRATHTAADSAAGRMISVVEEALGRKAPAEWLADRLTRWLVPAVLCLAAATAVGVLLGGGAGEEALLRSLTVLVVTCPCALGIATPLAKVAALGIGRSRGILVRDPTALERMPSLDVLVLDKTGTVTEGRYALRDTVVEGAEAEEALGRAGSLASRTDHAVARAIVQRAVSAALALEEAAEIVEAAGLGLTGTVAGRPTALGCRRWMEAQGLAVSTRLERAQGEFESQGSTIAFVGWDDRARAVFAFGDTLKVGAARSVEELRSRGLTLHLVSGDSAGATSAVARQLGIGSFFGNALPEDKVALVQKLRASGHRVGMVGDGLNDAAALAEADVGFALGAGSALLSHAADVVILAADPDRLSEALDHATLSSRILRQNLFLAFLYNALALPLALSGLLNPILAALAMWGSSLTVVVNTLRIGRKNSPG